MALRNHASTFTFDDSKTRILNSKMKFEGGVFFFFLYLRYFLSQRERHAVNDTEAFTVDLKTVKKIRHSRGAIRKDIISSMLK